MTTETDNARRPCHQRVHPQGLHLRRLEHRRERFGHPLRRWRDLSLHRGRHPLRPVDGRRARYTVTFSANLGSGTMANETDNTPTPLTPNAFTRAGYTFAGWNTAANGGGTSYADGAIYSFTASTTLYAQWTAASSPPSPPSPPSRLPRPPSVSAPPPDGHRGLPQLWPGLGGYLGHDHRHRVLHRRRRHRRSTSVPPRPRR